MDIERRSSGGGGEREDKNGDEGQHDGDQGLKQSNRAPRDHNEQMSSGRHVRSRLLVLVAGAFVTNSYFAYSLGSLPDSPLVLTSHGTTSECLVLNNMFDPSVEREHEFYLEVGENIHEECAQCGPVHHYYVDKNSGFVYLRFDSKRTATLAQKMFHGRFHEGKLITATFMDTREY
ncbi:hypothetical protein ACP70R_005125 [Stipagrostis hirtigluma subsp. patula]